MYNVWTADGRAYRVIVALYALEKIIIKILLHNGVTATTTTMIMILSSLEHWIHFRLIIFSSAFFIAYLANGMTELEWTLCGSQTHAHHESTFIGTAACTPLKSIEKFQTDKCYYQRRWRRFWQFRIIKCRMTSDFFGFISGLTLNDFVCACVWFADKCWSLLHFDGRERGRDECVHLYFDHLIAFTASPKTTHWIGSMAVGWAKHSSHTQFGI